MIETYHMLNLAKMQLHGHHVWSWVRCEELKLSKESPLGQLCLQKLSEVFSGVMIIMWECQGQSCSLPFSSQVWYDDPDIPVLVFAPPVNLDPENSWVILHQLVLYLGKGILIDLMVVLLVPASLVELDAIITHQDTAATTCPHTCPVCWWPLC